MLLKSGVYRIRNKVNQKVYIGSSAESAQGRITIHLRDLRANRHYNRFLQRSFNKYGEENFEFEIIERCLPEDAVKTEQKWMDFYKSYDKKLGYNLSPTAGSVLGIKRNARSRAKMRAVALRTGADPEVVKKRIEGVRRAYENDPELRIRKSEASKKAQADPEYRKRLSATLKAASATPEAKANRSAGAKARLARPEERERLVRQCRHNCTDPAIRKKIAEGVARAWKDPEIRARKIAAIKASKEKAKERRSQTNDGKT